MGSGLGTRLLDTSSPLPGYELVGVSRVLSISWIFSLCLATFPLSYSMRGVFAPLLRVRMIPIKLLEPQSSEAGEVLGPMTANSPSQILKFNPHELAAVIRTLQHLAYTETMVRKSNGTGVGDHLVLVKSPMRV